MKKIVIICCCTIITAAFFLLTASAKKQVADIVIKNEDADEKGFVVMELFTSQGCSSCPPADELLGKYAQLNNKQIIALAFHVDYWNRLGWVDSFSNSKFSQRQRDYATILNTESVYTPQLVINGEKEMVGSDVEKIKAVVNSAADEKPLIQFNILNTRIRSNKVTVQYKIEGEKSNLLVHAALVESKVYTNIKAGENRGVKLFNYNVVRDFVTVSKKDEPGNILLQLPQNSTAANFIIVLLAQDKKSGKIVGAYKQQAE
jgi:hypothetical protein